MLADRLARLCGALEDDESRDVIAMIGATGTVDDLVHAVRSQAPPADIAARLDQVEDALLAAGVDGMTGRDRSYQPLPGTQPHLVVETWLCPSSVCDRVVVSEETGPSPRTCALQDRPLRRITLET